MIWALAAKTANSKCFIPSILSHTALQKPYPSCCHYIGKNYSSCSYIGNCLSNLIQLNSYQSNYKCPKLFRKTSGDKNSLDPSELDKLNSNFSRVSLWHFSTFSPEQHLQSFGRISLQQKCWKETRNKAEYSCDLTFKKLFY